MNLSDVELEAIQADCYRIAVAMINNTKGST